MNIPGIKPLDTLCQLHGYKLVRGKTDSGDAVLIKIPAHDYHSDAQKLALEHEMAMLKKAGNTCALAPQQLYEANGRLALILTDLGVIPLSKYALSAENISDLFLEIATKLKALHEASIIHAGLTPQSIFIDAENKVYFGQMEHSFEVGSASTEDVETRLLTENITYISPEQTGRVDRDVDFRSDYYSLGIILYELLTGHPPFAATDPVQLVHLHIAKQPSAPLMQDERFPPVLGDICLKLLRKSPDDRYQSMTGLIHDVEYTRELAKTGRLGERIELGTQDRITRFQIPDDLFGRTQERHVFKLALKRIEEGHTELILIQGEAGSGKTRLIESALKAAKGQVHLLRGRFDSQHQDIPFAPLVSALQGWFQLLLTGDSKTVDKWRPKLKQAIGHGGKLLIRYIPEIQTLFPKLPQIASLAPKELQSLFRDSILNLISLLAKSEEPTALIIDDLQRADNATMSLLKVVWSLNNIQSFMIVLAYRKENIEDTLAPHIEELKTLRKTVTSLPIKPLDQQQISELIAATIGSDPKRLSELAGIVREKTGGNPFFVTQLLKTLHSDRLIYVSTGSSDWQWNLEKIRSIESSENVVELMTKKILRLNESTQSALSAAACIGTEFPLSLLAAVTHQSEETTRTNLGEAIREGLLIETEGTSEQRLHFLHERVQHAAYHLLKKENQIRLHYALGHWLLDQEADPENDSRLLQVVYHLNIAKELAISIEDRIQLATLNLQAARKQRINGSYESAAKYCFLAETLAKELSWQQYEALLFDLLLTQGEINYLIGNTEIADNQFDELLASTTDPVSKARALLVKASSYTIIAQSDRSVQIGLDGLKLLNSEIPDTPDAQKNAFKAMLCEIETTLQSETDSEILSRSDINDEHDALCIELLTIILTPAYQTNPYLWALVAIKVFDINLRKGFSASSPAAIMNLGAAMGSLYHDFNLGHRFAQIALKLSDRYPTSALKCHLGWVYGSMISFWTQPISQAIHYLEQNRDLAQHAGNPLYVCFSLSLNIRAQIASGQPLHELDAYWSHYEKSVMRTHSRDGINAYVVGGRLIKALQGKTLKPTSFSDSHFDEDQLAKEVEASPAKSPWTYHRLAKLILHYFAGNYQEAQKIAQEAEPNFMFALGQISFAEFTFYYALTLVKLIRLSPDDNDLKTHLGHCLDRLKLWSDQCPENFLDKFTLAQAEFQSVCGDQKSAIALYDKAIEHAKKNGFRQNQALAYELAGRFYYANHLSYLVAAYLNEAHIHYLIWGAKTLASRLENEFRDFLGENIAHNWKRYHHDNMLEQTNRKGSQFLDAIAVLKASQTLSGEIVLENLLKKLIHIIIENAGAQKGFLIMPQNNVLTITARCDIQKSDAVFTEPTPLDEANDLCKSIVHYAHRSKQDVILHNASDDAEIFVEDPYILHSKPKSILCLPITNRGDIVCHIYLENNSTSDAFTGSRLQVLKLLSTEIAISIENASLYERLSSSSHDLSHTHTKLEYYSRTLEKQVAQRTIELDKENESLEMALSEIEETKDRLLVQEKLASLGALTAGIAHEIRNPLNFIESFSDLSIDLVNELQESVENKDKSISDELRGFFADFFSGFHDNLNRIKEHDGRATRIVNDMLAHAGGSDAEWKKTDLNQLVEEYAKLTFHGMRAKSSAFNIDIVYELDAQDCTAYVQPQEIGRVLLNIMSNACYAANERALNTPPTQSYAPRLTVGTKHGKDCIEISIADNGTGMPQHIIDRIFDPFFTTKPAGEGTGLGLSLCHEIIAKEHGGKIEINSKDGEFTQFKLVIPISKVADNDNG